MNISEQTVKVHIRNLLRKLNSAHAWRPPFCSCNNAGHNKKARWHHHRASFYLLSCGDKCSSPARYYVQSPHGEYRWQVRFRHHLPRGNGFAKSLLLKGINAYMLSTRILLWSVLTNWRTVHHRGGCRWDQMNVSTLQRSQCSIAVFRIEAIRSGVCIGAILALPSAMPTRPNIIQPSNLPDFFAVEYASPAQGATSLFVERIGFRIQRPVQ